MRQSVLDERLEEEKKRVRIRVWPDTMLFYCKDRLGSMRHESHPALYTQYLKGLCPNHETENAPADYIESHVE